MYIPHTDNERAAMLEAIGVARVDDLYADVPADLPQRPPDLPEGEDELAVQRLLGELATRNTPATQLRCFLGGGAYAHYIPAAVGAVVSRGEFLTAYTPYQAEASQGTLATIYEFQSMVAELYGLDVANASMYDGASALAEAVIVAVRHTRRGRVLVSQTLAPNYRDVIRAYLARQRVEIDVVPMRDGLTDMDTLRARLDDDVAAVVFQHPNALGLLEPASALSDAAHEHGALSVTCGHPLAFGLLRPPGEFGADIACGEGQPLGLPLAYGGPYVGLLAARNELMRKLPGRLVGRADDAQGNQGYVLTLQTREQHIRRDKATSNICSNQAACALACTVYLSLLGPQGVREVATRNVQNRDRLMARLQESPLVAQGRACLPHPGPGFNEFVLRVETDPHAVLRAMRQHDVLGGLALDRWYPELDRHILVCTTELHTPQDHDAWMNALEASL